jgi:hypothetical protein
MADRQGNNRSTEPAFCLREMGSQRPPEEASSTGDDGSHDWAWLSEVGWWLGWFANKQVSAGDCRCDLETEIDV